MKIEAKLNLPQNCKLESHSCYVRTPSNGYHLYFKLEGEVKFKTKIENAVEILCKKTINVAGSLKEEKEYNLISFP